MKGGASGRLFASLVDKAVFRGLPDRLRSVRIHYTYYNKGGALVRGTMTAILDEEVYERLYRRVGEKDESPYGETRSSSCSGLGARRRIQGHDDGRGARTRGCGMVRRTFEGRDR